MIRSSLSGGFFYGEEFSRYLAVLWGSTCAEVNFNDVAIELCWYYVAAWEFLRICSISTEHPFERHIWGTAYVSLTQDFVSPVRHKYP